MPVNRRSDPLPLSVPEFQIMLSLVDQEMHGYALIRDIEQRTDSEVSLTASTLYAALKRMLRDAWIEECDPPDSDGDARRRHYRLTARGLELLKRESARLERATHMARGKRLLPEPA